ncbi:hypothetical protein N5K37_13810 [Delftia tsuruhatensis]|uniref:hypothetical protein n=1 Tax=Delftia tsuruhatensis TaxID=180282 RepID=UPI000A6D60F3|nr:hypothetical protein [Delftia tsuruhatensis]MDH2230989.1 hypothetical protein [Delftia tsuruhatensis]
MQQSPEEFELDFEFPDELDPDKPLVLLLGWVDHEGIVSSLKTSKRQYKKKLLTSRPENWDATADMFNEFEISSVVGKFSVDVLRLIVDKRYRQVRQRLFAAIGSVPNQVYLYEDILTGKRQSEFDEEFMPYPARPILDEALEFLRQNNIEIIPYKRKAEVTVLADAFLDDSDKNLLFRLYMPSGRIWSEEADRFLRLFQDYMLKVDRLQVRLDQKRTEHGVVYEFHGKSPEGHRTLAPEFEEFSKLMNLFLADTNAAAELITTKGGNSAEISAVISRYAKEARRLEVDLRHSAENKALSIRQRLESDLLDFDITPEELRGISLAVSQAIPKIDGFIGGHSIYPGQPALTPRSSTHLTLNIRPQFINSVNSVISQEINGNQHFSPEQHQLLEVIEKHGGSDAKSLETAVYEIADNGVEKVDRLKAKKKLSAFLMEMGRRTGDMAFGILQSYIEKQIGL